MDHSRVNAIPVTGTFKVDQSVDGPFEATSIEFDNSEDDLWFSGIYVDESGKIQRLTIILPDKPGTSSGRFNHDAAGYYTRRANNTSEFWHSVSGDYKATFIKGAEDLDGEFHFLGSWPGSEDQEFSGTFDIQTGPLSVKAKPV